MFELLYYLDEFIKWNLEQFATEKTWGGGRNPPAPSLNGVRQQDVHKESTNHSQAKPVKYTSCYSFPTLVPSINTTKSI